MTNRFKEHLRKFDESKIVKWVDTIGFKVMNRSQPAQDAVQWRDFVNRRKTTVCHKGWGFIRIKCL